MTFAHFGLFAQSSEIVIKLNQLDGYRSIFQGSQVATDNNVVGGFDYTFGFNGFLNSETYVGIGMAYTPVKSTLTTINEASTGKNTRVQTAEDTRYKVGIYAGKLNRYKKFRFYSQLGVYVRLYRDQKTTNNVVNQDVGGVVILTSDEIVNITNAHEFILGISQGVYYNFYKGFSFGIDINVNSVLGIKNGTDVKNQTTTTAGNVTNTTTSTVHDNTFYNLRLLPCIGVRYTLH